MSLRYQKILEKLTVASDMSFNFYQFVWLAVQLFNEVKKMLMT